MEGDLKTHHQISMSYIKSKYKSRICIVALLDFLGISNFGKSETLLFLRKRESMLKAYPKFVLDMKCRYNFIGVNNSPNLYTFGDTLLIVWPLEKELDELNGLLVMAELLNHLFSWGFAEALLFRGAISCGEVIESKKRMMYVLLDLQSQIAHLGMRNQIGLALLQHQSLVLTLMHFSKTILIKVENKQLIYYIGFI